MGFGARWRAERSSGQDRGLLTVQTWGVPGILLRVLQVLLAVAAAMAS